MSKKTTDETMGRETVKEYLQQYHTAVGKSGSWRNATASFPANCGHPVRGPRSG